MEKLAFTVIGASLAVVAMTLIPMLMQTTSQPVETTAATKSNMSEQEFTAMMMGDMCNAETGSVIAAHQHPLRPVSPDLPVPMVNHLVFPDPMGGYNIQILTQNFTFTPAAINRAVVPNEGHAHIYVNGIKITRVYSDWFHLASNYLQAGENLVTVSLNANDHSEWANDGAQIASTVRVVKPTITQ